MDDVILMGVINLLLCGWVVYLRIRNERLAIALNGAFMMVEDLAEGRAVIEKTANGFSVRRIKDD